MLSTIKNRKEQGFTIIEVLIVLAIAGLILLVVFLAVPALQRNARNTSRKQDVANIMAGISEYVNNNNGNLPGGKTDSGNTLTFTAQGGGGNTVPVSLGFYAPSDVSLTFYTSGMTNNSTVDNVRLITEAKCDPDDTDVGEPIAGSDRSIIAMYRVEPDSKQCAES